MYVWHALCIGAWCVCVHKCLQFVGVAGNTFNILQNACSAERTYSEKHLLNKPDNVFLSGTPSRGT